MSVKSTASGGRTSGKKSWRGVLRPYLYLVPALLFLGLFIFWPLVQVTLLSFFQWNLISPRIPFVGLENYTSLFTDTEFLWVLFQTLMYILIALLGNFLLPVGLAALTVQAGRRFTGLYQSLLFTPTVVAVSVGAILWQFIYLPTGGLLNSFLSLFGLPEGNWLNNPYTALPAIGVVAAWQFMGFNYLVALAGLMAVPKEYLEAARVDGATGWPLIRSVIIPLLMPTLLFVALTSILQALPNAFVPIEILTRGGPSESSDNLLYTIYQDGFQFFQIGRASAEAVLTILLLGGAAIWQFRILDRSLDYER